MFACVKRCVDAVVWVVWVVCLLRVGTRQMVEYVWARGFEIVLTLEQLEVHSEEATGEREQGEREG